MTGCGTVTEIQKAHSLGVEFCKIFPGDLIGGPAFVKAVKGSLRRDNYEDVNRWPLGGSFRRQLAGGL